MSESPTHPDAPPSSTNYQAYFNKVVGNYAEAVLLDRGGERHQRASKAVDVLEREYSLATALLDHVRSNLCFAPIEMCAMTGGDWRAVVATCKATYPMLATQIDEFVECGGFADER